MVLGGEQKLPAEYVTGLTMVNPDTGSVILAQPESDALLPRDGGSSKDAMPETDYLRVQKTTALISTVFIGAALAVVSTGAYLIGGGLTASIVAAALAGLTMYLAGPAFFSQIAQTIAFKMLYGETREAGHSELSGKEASYPKDFGKQTNKDAVVAQSTTLRRIMGNIIFMAYGFILITAGSVVTYCIAHDLIRSANPEAAGIIGGFIGFLLALHPFWTSLDMRGDEMHEESNSKAAQQSESGKNEGQIDVEKWLNAKVAIEDLNKDMFRDYDYRRTGVGPEVTPEVMFRFGLAWAKMALEKARQAGITNRDVIIARDARKIEEDLPQALIDALRYAGLNVKYTAAKGPNAVTSYSWAIQAYRPLMSLFITASHVSKPKDEKVRGFKVAMMKESGGVVQSLTTREIKQESYAIISELIQDPGKILGLKAQKAGTYETVEIDQDCIRLNSLIGKAAAAGVSLFELARRVNSPDVFRVLEKEEAKYKDARPLTGVSIVVEGFNTPSGRLGYETFKNLGATVTLLNPDIIEVEGEHNADPAKDKNLARLKKEIENTDAAFGIAFDLDGDRGAIIVPERHENGTVTFTTLTPDNIIVALLDYLIDKWGYKQEHTGQKIAVIRDVLGTFAVNDKTGLMGAEAFQTDAGYVF